jgi:hypothetical protein
VSGVDCSVVVLFSATSTPSVHIKLQILYLTPRLRFSAGFGEVAT